jgi:putative oxygen-independent coproporphyrinogen III oxidase
LTARAQPAAPLAIYVHWPYCARICPYCDFNVVRARGGDAPARLASAIVDDLRGQARGLGPRRLGSIFFGGGTPSLMPPAVVAEIIAVAGALWPADEPVEITLEANPADAAGFSALAAAGVNRLSLGVQSLDDAALAFLGRDHDAAQARSALNAAQAAFNRVSIDLIYARPDQTPAAWSRELTEAASLGPEHISPYQLTIEPGTAFGRAAARGRIPQIDQDLGLALYEATQSVLGEAGYDAYEVSNHARGEAARARHNLAVWRGGDYLGVGPGAHGRRTADGARVATVTASKVADYVARVGATGVGVVSEDRLSQREAAEERLLMGLRTSEGVAWRDVAVLGLGPRRSLIIELASQGWLTVGATALLATSRGRPVLDHLTMKLAQAAAADVHAA